MNLPRMKNRERIEYKKLFKTHLPLLFDYLDRETMINTNTAFTIWTSCLNWLTVKYIFLKLLCI